MLINGLGGVGKTELCRRYFWESLDRCPHLAWIDYLGSLKESFASQFTGIPAPKEQTLEERFAAVLLELSSLEPNSLLIIDNIDRPEDPDLPCLRALPFKVIANSRLALTGFEAYPLGFLSPGKCTELFLRHYKGKADDRALQQLLERAGYHTLAVELLAKTGAAAGLSIPALLEKLTQAGFNLSNLVPETVPLDWHGETARRRLFQHLEKVFDLSALGEDERYVLANLAVLPPLYLDRGEVSEWLQLASKDPLNALVEKGWLQEQDGQVFCHQVIQEVARARLQPQLDTCRSLLNSLSGKLRYDGTDNPVTRAPYLPLAQSLLDCFPAAPDPDVATLANNLAAIYDVFAQYSRSEPLYRRALEIGEKTLGKDHPAVATWLNNLALLLNTQGNYAEAEPLYRRALEIDEKALGKDHPGVATDLNNLALLLSDQGKYAEAEPLYRRALEIGEKTLGKDHPAVATRLNNLALLLSAQGRYAEAEPLFRRALEIIEKALGNDHPTVASGLNNLALLLKTQGHYAEAEPLYRRALKINEKALGKDHPNTKTMRNNLNDLLEQMKKQPSP